MEIKEAKFYIAEVVCMLEYLHKNNIVYRDLKPENLMICSDGHLKLVDFGAAKHMKKDRTYTLMGSLHYIAPEVLDQTGHSYEADIFSLGVLFYELICGSLPFGNDVKDPCEVYNQMISKKVKFHPYIQDKAVKKLIRKMLKKSKVSRAKVTIPFIKSNEVFKDFNWVNDLYFHPLFLILFRNWFWITPTSRRTIRKL